MNKVARSTNETMNWAETKEPKFQISLVGNAAMHDITHDHLDPKQCVIPNSKYRWAFKFVSNYRLYCTSTRTLFNVRGYRLFRQRM